jgi:hypothetical protein
MPEHAKPSHSAQRNRRLTLAATAALVTGGLLAGGVAVAAALTSESGRTGDAASAADGGAGSGDSARSLAEDPDSEQLGVDDSDEALAAYGPAVAAQLAYVRDHWQSTEDDTFGFLDENDCANFASQSLLARGFAEDDDWWYSGDGDGYASAPAWVSSTALMEYLEEHPELATQLTDDQRDQVKPGDIVQFDWDGSGDRDHTGIVTAVVPRSDGTIAIAYAGHTDATWDRSVDYVITVLHPGGAATYWSIAE